MELAGKYVDLKPLGSIANFSTNEQLEGAINTLMKQGYTFEEAFGSLMSGQDLRPVMRSGK